MHALVLLGLYAMVRLGIWQWGRGEVTGSLRNYSYGLEWWAFAALTLIGWGKFCLDETAATQLDAEAAQSVAGPRPPSLPVAQPVSAAEDPDLAAWNAQFAELARRDAEGSS